MSNQSSAYNPAAAHLPIARSTAIPGWVRAVVIVGALLMGLGAIIALVNPSLLVGPHDLITGAVRIYAGYLTSRNLTIAVMLLAAMALRSTAMLNSLMLLTGFIQWVDAILDCLEGRWLVAPGVIVIGTLFLLASARVSGYPFWRSGAWKSAD